MDSPVLRRNKYGTLIMLYPRDAHAVYLDSGSTMKEKNYSLIKSVLNDAMGGRSEEHTSELQSPLIISYAVFCLKKKFF